MRATLWWLLLPACGLSEYRLVGSRRAGDPGTDVAVQGPRALLDTGVGDRPQELPLQPGLAGDLAITKVSLYQGIERPLVVDGSAPANPLELPVIAERDALLRVFVAPDAGFEPRDLLVVVELGTPGEREPLRLRQRRRIARSSTDADLDTTFTLTLPGSALQLDTELRVELREVGFGVESTGDEASSTFDSARDLDGGLPVERGDELRLVLIPFRYTADGSDRLPDTSDAALADLVDLLEAMYPVRSVELEVAAPWDWGDPIRPDGSGFTEALVAVSNARDVADEPANTYYYGLFDPASSFQAFCPQGCVVGLSNLAASTRYPGQRASVGVGFTSFDIAADTLAHELGHAHGREHAPCGGPAGVDRNYPHNNARIGAWAYDRRSRELLAPGDRVDIMSYCDPTWISDYNFAALFARNTALSMALRSAPRLVTRVVVGPSGDVVDQRWVAEEAGVGDGELIAVEVFDGAGVSRGLRNGWWTRFSHLSGGMVMLEEALPEDWVAIPLDIGG